MVGPLGSGQPAMPQQVLLLGLVGVFPCRALYIIRDGASDSPWCAPSQVHGIQLEELNPIVESLFPGRPAMLELAGDAV